jgi:hypothetical protein
MDPMCWFNQSNVHHLSTFSLCFWFMFHVEFVDPRCDSKEIKMGLDVKI